IAGFLGALTLHLNKYLITITTVSAIGSIRGHTVYQAIDFEIIPVINPTGQTASPDSELLALVKNHLNSAKLYFSYTLDISNSLQRQAQKGTLPEAFSYTQFDDRFFWNKHLVRDLLAVDHPDISKFVLPVINGFVSLSKTTICGKRVTFGIISRRSRFRAGTRYFTRGVDGNGNVANFNETEQILILHDYDGEPTMSYVQIRGSVPLVWQEINTLKYVPALHIGTPSRLPQDPRKLDASSKAASANSTFTSVQSLGLPATEKHLQQLLAYYNQVYIVNLVNNKGRERRIKSALEVAMSNLEKYADRVKYVYFDFHHECSGMRWDRVSLLVDLLRAQGLAIDDFNVNNSLWFEAHMLSSTGVASSSTLVTDRLQTAVVRTNCMDCLDRTNVVQSFIARWVLHQQLMSYGIINTLSTSFDGVDPAFESMFRNTWAENGNVISEAYSGTGALKTDFTRTGRRTRRGALSDLYNSIHRYILNNFYDGHRQDAYDLFLGVYDPATDSTLAEALTYDKRPLLLQAAPYLIYSGILMLIAAWLLPRQNVESRMPMSLFVLLWIGILLYGLSLVLLNRTSYVNWPKLSPPDFV
ncbi:hypothetical protein CANCADRAFT_16693, partial [Tortispora caseinolytica NRRL Y-17796]